MARIIVDGYNLIGVLHTDHEAERRRLIEDLGAYSKRKGHEVSVVFDGWRNGHGPESASVQSGVCVIYSGLGEKADSVIGRMVSQCDGQWIVVSSDREVQRRAWASNSVPVESELFLDIIHGGQGTGEDDDDYDGLPGRGNPSKPSKKQKALERALRKL